jgi:hypothetical protein
MEITGQLHSLAALASVKYFMKNLRLGGHQSRPGLCGEQENLLFLSMYSQRVIVNVENN